MTQLDDRAVETTPTDPPRSRRRRRGGLARTIAIKLLIGLTTIWMSSTVVFAAVEVLPQDPAMTALGIESTAAQREEFREANGLNDPALTRYLRWAGGMVQGDFGTSVVTDKPIIDELGPRLNNTAILALGAVLLSVVVGLPLALIAGRRPGGPFDATVNLLTLTLNAIPEFGIAIALAWLFASQLDVLPLVSTGIEYGNYGAYVLPILTLGLVAISYVYRFSRVGVIEAEQAPFIRAASLRGIAPLRVATHHVLPVASSAVINVVALHAIVLLGGVVVVENVFAYPGLGTLLITAVESNDLPVIEAVAVVTSALLVAINFIADALVVLLNPRTRGASK